VSSKQYKFEKLSPLTKEDADEMNFFLKLIKNASEGYAMHYGLEDNVYIVYADLQENRYKELITSLDERGYDYTVEECIFRH